MRRNDKEGEDLREDAFNERSEEVIKKKETRDGNEEKEKEAHHRKQLSHCLLFSSLLSLSLSLSFSLPLSRRIN